MRKSMCLVFGAVVIFGLTVIAEKAPDSFSTVMKDNGATLQKIGKDVDAKDYDAIAASATKLKNNFAGPVGTFFTGRKDDVALKHCQAAHDASAALETAAKAKNDSGIADARKTLQGACGACHMARREKMPDGTFEIKQ